MSPTLYLGLPYLKATIERVIWFHFSKNTGPPGKNYFCAEPVSNCTDAFNLAQSVAVGPTHKLGRMVARKLPLPGRMRPCLISRGISQKCISGNPGHRRKRLSPAGVGDNLLFAMLAWCRSNSQQKE